jgi:PAS domain S-box-containing protein
MPEQHASGPASRPRAGDGGPTRQARGSPLASCGDGSEDALRWILDALPEAVCTTDAQGRLTYFNPACVELSGRTPELGSDRWSGAWQLLHADGRPIPREEHPMALALAEGRAVESAEIVAERPDGTRVPLTVRSTPTFDERGSLTGGIHTLVRTGEFELDGTAGAYLAAIVQNSDDAIITKTLGGIITTWNASAERLFGYSAQEAIGRPISMLIPPERRGEEQALLERLRRGERVGHFETRRVRKDGSTLDISLTISPVKDASGRIVGASKVARDITGRVQIEQALRDSEQRFRTIADNMSQLAWTCDSLGNATWYNKRWLDYTGLSFEEMRGDGWSKVQHPEHLERVVGSVRRSAESGEPWEDTFPLRGKDGRYRWFLSRAVPIRDEDGRIASWFGTNTDVTEQFEAEEALRAADRRKDEFLATLSHELRNPLASISSAVQVLKLQERGSENLIQQKAREIIERQVTNLTSMVTDLLDLSRITSGHVRLNRQRVDVNPLIRHAVETVHTLVEKHGHELSTELCDAPVWVYGDSTRIEEVLVNLLSNAVKYTPDGGRITVHCENSPDGDHVTIRVRDTGIGIDAQFLPRIFELFSQADRSLARSGGGLGIGLAIAHRVVELHGGTIEARSPGVGQGSEFKVRLPAVPAPTDEATGAGTGAPERRKGDGTRVLVVDDNLDQVMMLTTLLRQMGYSVQSAYTGPDGLQIAQQWRPDVVLLDIGLPGLDGYEVARRIRSTPEPERWKTRLIACTGYGRQADLRRAREAGFDAHIVKPVDARELQEVMLSPARNLGPAREARGG